jgi:REP element-mobilizing transposase RayT
MPEALAYFLTWTTYGTWLPGDDRGWVRFSRGAQLPNPIIEREAAARMTEDACRLDHEQRRLVEATIANHCRIRQWELHVVNCRSNHVHVVVAAKNHPDDVREQFKAWCTRRLKALELERKRRFGTSVFGEQEPHSVREKWWSERGSGLYINDEEGLEAIIHYVGVAQDLPSETG